MTRLILSAGALLLVVGPRPVSAQAVRVAATVRVSDGLVASVYYGPRPVVLHPARVVVVRPAPVVIVTRPIVHAHRHGRAHGRLSREFARHHSRGHRGHPPGLRVVRWDGR
jgi:hypothetical protein